MKKAFHFSNEQKEMLGVIATRSLVIPLARRIHEGGFSPEHEFTPKEF